MTERRYPLESLLDAAGMTLSQLREVCPMGGSVYRNARTVGLTEAQADRWACKVGLVPWLVWGDWLDDAQVECAERSCTERFVPSRKNHIYCSRTCCIRKQMQEYRARRSDDPEYQAFRRAESRAYYEECGDYVRARQRAYNRRRSAA